MINDYCIYLFCGSSLLFLLLQYLPLPSALSIFPICFLLLFFLFFISLLSKVRATKTLTVSNSTGNVSWTVSHFYCTIRTELCLLYCTMSVLLQLSSCPLQTNKTVVHYISSSAGYSTANSFNKQARPYCSLQHLRLLWWWMRMLCIVVVAFFANVNVTTVSKVFSKKNI